MATLLIDPSWLVGAFQYKEYLGRKEAGGSSLAEAVDVTACRINIAPSFERSGTETIKIGDAKIFCYADYTEGVDLKDLKERSEVIIDGQTYIVKKIAKRYEIDEPKLFAVEMVVL